MKKDVFMKFAKGVKQLAEQCMEDGRSDNITHIGAMCESDDKEDEIVFYCDGRPSALASCLASVIAKVVAANGLPEIWIDEIALKARRTLNQWQDMTGDESEDE